MNNLKEIPWKFVIEILNPGTYHDQIPFLFYNIQA